jgi:hypothetical protein
MAVAATRARVNVKPGMLTEERGCCSGAGTSGYERKGLSYKYGTKFTDPPASAVLCIKKMSRKHAQIQSNSRKVLARESKREESVMVRRLTWELLPL